MTDLADMGCRLLAAMLAGTVLGLERESHGRAAGLRTTVLVCIAPCLGMILSEVFYRGSLMTYGGAGTWRPDPMRLAAGILAGIGFIGGGVILKQDHLVRGVTTAAVLWVSTLLGLVFGAGHFTLGAMGLILSVITLLGFPYLEKFVYNDWYSELSITTSPVPFSAETAKRLLNARGIAVKNVQVDSDTAIPTHILTLQLKHKKRDLLLLPQQVRDDFLALEGVMRVQWK